MPPDETTREAAAFAGRNKVPLAFTALLAALSTISPFAMDAYLPSLTAVGEALHASAFQLQQTLSVYTLGLALMSLWHGALSDALGRRPVLIAALAAFTLASLGCATADDIGVLMVARLFQGFSGGAGMVLSRAIVRDTVQGAPAQRLMSQIMLMFSIAPAFGPIIGGWLHEWFGWRAVFWFMFAWGLALLIWLTIGLRETLPSAQRVSLRPMALLRAYWTILRSLRFHLLSATTALSFQCFFQYVGASTGFLKEQLGLSETQFGYFFVPTVLGFMLGSALSGRLAGRVPLRMIVSGGLVLIMVSAAFNIIWHAFMPAGVWASIAPVTVGTLGIALVLPGTQLLVLDLFPERRGTAASCQVFAQLVCNTLSLAVISIALSGSTLLLALGTGGWVAAAAACWFTYLRISARPPDA